MMATTRGEGSIVQLDKGIDGKKAKSKCRKWRLVVCIGRDPRSKEVRYLQKARNFQGSYTEAKKALRKFIAEIESGNIATRKTWTYNQYAEHFLDARKASGKFADGTIVTNRVQLKSLGRLIGNLKLQDITPEIIEAAYADLRSGTNGIPKPISGSMLFNINRIFFIMIKDAQKKGIMTSNPLENVERPKRDTKERRALPPNEYRRILEEMNPEDEHECAVLLCAGLGLRRGEALALSWGDVDFSEATINIHASLDDNAKMKGPKTESGNRVLPLANKLSDALMRRKAVQVQNFLKTEPKFILVLGKADEAKKPTGAIIVDGYIYDLAPNAPVICTEYGNRFKPKAFSRWWRENRGKFGLEGWTFHELRHSFLTAAALNGVHPAVMQELAGHKNPETAIGVYTHINMDSKREAVDTLEAVYM